MASADALRQRHNALIDELARRGAAWHEVGQRPDDDRYELDLMAVVSVERDTNAAIVECVGDGGGADYEGEIFDSEDAAYRAAVEVNTQELAYAKKHPQEAVWVPDDFDWDGR